MISVISVAILKTIINDLMIYYFIHQVSSFWADIYVLLNIGWWHVLR